MAPPKRREDCNTLIHPLFRRDLFHSKDGTLLDEEAYDSVVRRPAVLATRLLDSPQCLHYFYVTYFGRNTKIKGTFLERCASDKGVNDLSLSDIEATRNQLILLAGRVRFMFVDMPIGAAGLCCCCPPLPGVRGCDSVIQLSTMLYGIGLNQDRNGEGNYHVDFHIAMAMLHELAHAANGDVKGPANEDCFEESIAAEAGFELISRIFGLCPLPYTSTFSDTIWIDWQSPMLHRAGYDVNRICHKQDRLARRDFQCFTDSDFIRKLFDQTFWEGDYAKHGGITLIPPPVIDLCREGNANKAFNDLPRSVRQLYMASEGISFKERGRPHLANNDFEIRKSTSEAQNDDV